MTWGQYSFPFMPMVDRFKWLEPRHMVNICDRWNIDKTADLQFAFFNGVGWESWENIWGIWNGITPRDAEATRRVAAIERAVARSSSARSGSRSFPCTTSASTPAAGRWESKRLDHRQPQPTTSAAGKWMSSPRPACATSTSITALS